MRRLLASPYVQFYVQSIHTLNNVVVYRIPVCTNSFTRLGHAALVQEREILVYPSLTEDAADLLIDINMHTCV